ncbi:MAG: hypothetical protein CYPHOPRED_002904 [Cyphobasidiales sp. Tagirdzhanova-0007]|nr:MAG: hypothetical protein CYPHOPRED_002904 [Cyphobasidiales sp. Tagirdzhanova-0007]
MPNRSLYFMSQYPSLESSLSFFHSDFASVSAMSASFDAQVQADAATYFVWLGDFNEDDPYYYRIHSPVIIVEFDFHIVIHGAFVCSFPCTVMSTPSSPKPDGASTASPSLAPAEQAASPTPGNATTPAAAGSPAPSGVQSPRMLSKRESLISEVSGRNDVDNEEKAKVLGMLRRLQESDEAGLEQTEDNTGNDLQIALEGLDIGKSCTKGIVVLRVRGHIGILACCQKRKKLRCGSKGAQEI